MAHIRCEITNDGRSGRPWLMGMKTVIECADGTNLEVVPQVMGLQSQLAPLNPSDGLAKSGHALVTLTTREGARVVSGGTGEVEVYSNPNVTVDTSTCVYKAICHEGKLLMCDTKGCEFVLRGDQSLTISGNSVPTTDGVIADRGSSPRCTDASKAYRLPGAESLFQPQVVPPPRLFVIYGTGDAVEFVSEADGEAAIQAPHEDALAQDVHHPIPVAQHGSIMSHCLFRSRLADSTSVPIAPSSVPLPEGLDAGGGSMHSLFTQTSREASSQPGPALTEFRQLVQYPHVTEEVRAMFRGTLKQYRTWEATQIAKSRAIMAPPEAKGKKDQKKDKKVDKKEDKSQKKGGKRDKKASFALPDISEMDLLSAPTEPTFVPDLGNTLTPFDHHVQVLRLRAESKAMPSGGELLTKALSIRAGEGNEADPCFPGMELIPEEAAESVDGGFGYASTPEPRAESPVMPATPQMAALEEAAESAAAGAASPDALDSTAEPNGTRKSGNKLTGRMAVSETEFPFAYFKSEMGLQFLMDAGELDPERKLPAQKSRSLQGGRKRRDMRGASSMAQMPRSPWEPRLVGEEEPEQELYGQEDADQREERHSPGVDTSYSMNAEEDMAGQEDEVEERQLFAP